MEDDERATEMKWNVSTFSRFHF